VEEGATVGSRLIGWSVPVIVLVCVAVVVDVDVYVIIVGARVTLIVMLFSI
jgi:hypothetical protein